MVNTVRDHTMKQLKESTGLRAVVGKHKKLIIVSSIVVVFVGVVGGYCWWSLAGWNAVESQTRTAKQDMHHYLTGAVALPMSTADERAKKLTALETTSQRIESYKNICNVPVLVEWQRAIDTFKKQQDACRDTLAEFDRFKTSLKDITDYLYDDKTVAALVVTASTSSVDLDEASWPETAAKWHTLAEKIKPLKVSGRFEPVLKRITTEAEYMDASWQEVVAAHTAKDRARYEKAKDELSKSYGTFKDAVELSRSSIEPLLQDFQAKYDDIISN